MVVKLASISSAVLLGLARTIARIPPSMWLKLAIIATLIAVKQGVIP